MLVLESLLRSNPYITTKSLVLLASVIWVFISDSPKAADEVYVLFQHLIEIVFLWTIHLRFKIILYHTQLIVLELISSCLTVL